MGIKSSAQYEYDVVAREVATALMKPLHTLAGASFSFPSMLDPH